jgi:hypothetical protein
MKTVSGWGFLKPLKEAHRPMLQFTAMAQEHLWMLDERGDFESACGAVAGSGPMALESGTGKRCRKCGERAVSA